jgi:uncharacterized protein
MIAVDTNLLVYAHRPDMARHEQARAALASLAGARRAWAIPWACLHEFFSIITSRRALQPPTPYELAVAALRSIAGLPDLNLLSEGPGHLQRLIGLLETSRVGGPTVHDARIAAICLSHGVSELWTADRDFSYFPELRTRNPLVG